MNAIKGHHVHHHPNHIGGDLHGERGMGIKTGKRRDRINPYVCDGPAGELRFGKFHNIRGKGCVKSPPRPEAARRRERATGTPIIMKFDSFSP